MKKVTLENCFELIRNGASIKQYNNASGTPITRIETISFGELDYDKMGFADIYDDHYETYYLQKGDILMSHINSLKHLAKTAIVKAIERDVIHGMNLLMLRANSKVLHSPFAKFYFETNRFYTDILHISNQSVNQCSFSISKLKKLSIPLPPLSVQEEIAAQLDAADALRKKDLELLEAYDQLAQSVFIEMFGDPILNENGWNSIKGNKLIEILGGGVFKSKDYKKSGIPLIRIGVINKGYFDDTDLVFLDESFLNSHKRYIIKEGDMLITLTGTVGKNDYGNIFIIENDYDTYLLNQRVAKINLNDSLISKDYFKFYMKQLPVKGKLTGISRGVRQANISNKDLFDLDFLLPPLSLQNEFAERIKNIEAQKELVRQQSKKSELLFQALLDRNFNQ